MKNLFVKFTVSFPDAIPVNQIPALRQALPSVEIPVGDSDMDDAEPLMLQAFSEAQQNTKAAGGTEDDSDEDDDVNIGGG